MFFKTCLRIVSSNLLKQNKEILFKVPQIIKSYNINSVNSARHIQKVRLYSSQANTDNCKIYKDNENKKPVYIGLLSQQIKLVKVFSLTSSFIGIVIQPFLYNEVLAMNNIPLIVAAYSFVGFFTVGTPVLLHFIAKKYVTSLEYKSDTDSYIANTLNFFAMKKQLSFKLDDVKVPDVPGMFTTLLAKGKPLFLDPRSFEQPEHYAKLMGYDKPIDFKLYDTPPNEEEKRNK